MKKEEQVNLYLTEWVEFCIEHVEADEWKKFLTWIGKFPVFHQIEFTRCWADSFIGDIMADKLDSFKDVFIHRKAINLQ